MTCIDEIRTEIKKKYEGDAFTAHDFLTFGEHDAIRQTLARLAREGSIRRVLQGVYDKPAYSTTLKEFAVPSPHKVAFALARKYNWKIAVSGDGALNLLGLSTQVPAIWKYVSTGPYKKYTIGNTILEFQHRADVQMTSKSSQAVLIIQALKALGIKSCNDEVIKKIQKNLSPKEKKQLSKDSVTAPLWIHKLIKKISEE